jgi:protein-disulfide isomerase
MSTLSTKTKTVDAATLNRVLLVLASVGIYVALSLSIAHLAGAQLPCGSDTSVISGCDKVENDAWSKVFGVPTALFGLGAYLLIFSLAFIREIKGIEATRQVGTLLWGMLATGTLASVVLLSHAFFEIRATCLWCLANGAIMLISLLVQTTAQSAGEAVRKRMPLAFLLLPPFLALAAAGGLGYSAIRQAQAATFGKEIKLPEGAVLVRPESPSKGAADAEVLVVSFSDLHCPPCKKNHVELDAQMRGPLAGKVRVVFRHYPLAKRHPGAMDSAVLSEWAKSKGKFWEFVMLQYLNQELTTREEMMQLVKAAGLDVEEAKEVLADPTKRAPFQAVVKQDIADAQKLGVNSTPSWIVQYSDGTVTTATADGVFPLITDSMIALHHRK